jgi:predicted nucleotidyltransferase
MSEELQVLKTVCQRLHDASIPYMVTGSIAANFYAVPRMTRDIDIVIEIKNEDIPKLIRIFQADFYIDQESVFEAVQAQGMFNILHNEYVFKIDFIVRKVSTYRELEFQRRKRIKVDGMEICIVSLEDLILSKLFWAKDSFSEMQLGDVRNLLSATKKLDRDYIHKWVQSLGLEKIYEKVSG